MNKGRLEEIDRMCDTVEDALGKIRWHTDALDPEELIGFIVAGCSCAEALDFYFVEASSQYTAKEWAEIRGITNQGVCNNVQAAKRKLPEELLR